MSDAYAVLGHPIGHSRSPFIHARFAAQTGEDVVYTAIDVAPGEFRAAVSRFRDTGGCGVNVTLPFKEEAFALCAGHVSRRASRAGAVNTIGFEPDGAIRGDNTDGAGLVRDIERNLDVRIAGRRVLLLGAGGAARGVAGTLIERAPSELVVANRTATRARALAAALETLGPVRAAPSFDALAGGRFELVVNATSAGLAKSIPPVSPSAVAPGACCYDLVYGEAAAGFLAWARDAGAGLATDGAGMLVEQAAESFLLWRGVRPETPPVIAALRDALTSG